MRNHGDGGSLDIDAAFLGFAHGISGWGDICCLIPSNSMELKSGLLACEFMVVL
jgi:hypothetical protein